MNHAIYNTYVNDESALYNQADVFFNIQAKYAINASMMYALALNESGIGLSQYALEYHNLFGHAAIDENPVQYKSIADCVKQHAYNFLQQGYLNPDDSRYHGSWFGDKASGINVNMRLIRTGEKKQLVSIINWMKMVLTKKRIQSKQYNYPRT